MIRTQVRNFSYDALNRLTGSQYADQSTTTFTYDAGNRVTKISDSLSGMITRTYDNLDNLLSEAGPNGIVNYTYNVAHQRLSMTAGNSLSAQYSYDPFGGTVASGSSPNAAQYTGRENDGTGLYCYRARYYSPALDRFISEDP